MTKLNRIVGATPLARPGVIGDNDGYCVEDYRDPDYIQIAIFKNRVEIRSPGGLYDGLTMEEMLGGNVSRRRNPLIADLFRRIHMVEGWGRGMPLILENAPSVQFRQIAGLFIASFERPSFLEDTTQETTQEVIDTTQETVDITTKKPRKNHVKTTEKPRKNTKETPEKHQRNTKEILLTIIKGNPSFSVNALAVATKMSVDSIRHHLRTLKTAGRIRHVGPTKAGHWEILDSAEDKGAGE